MRIDPHDWDDVPLAEPPEDDARQDTHDDQRREHRCSDDTELLVGVVTMRAACNLAQIRQNFRAVVR